MLQDKKEYSNILSDQKFDLSGQIDKFISVTQNALSTLTLNQFSEGFYEILNLYEPITQSISSNFGKTRDYSAQIKENIAGAAYQAQILGIQTTSLANAQLGVIEGMKRPIQLTRDEMLNFAATAKLFGKEGASVAQMFSNLAPEMLKTGMQFGDITGNMMKVVETAQDYNVSIGSVYDLVSQNLSKINTFSFRNGVDGLVQMAATSTQLGVNMGDALKTSEQLMNPEKAQEFINEIQRFTGQVIPGLESPLKVSYMAMHDPAKLTQMVSDFFASQMKVGPKGEIQSPEYQRLLMTLPGFELLKGFNPIQSGIEAKRMEEVLKQIPIALSNNNLLTDEVKNVLKTTAKGKEGEYFVPTATGEKSVSALTANDIATIAKSVIPKGTDVQDRILLSQNNITKSINELIGALKTSGFEAARKVDINDVAKPIYDNLKLFTTSILKSAGAIESITKIKGVPDIITSGIGENMSVVFKDITNKLKKLLTGEESLTSVINSFTTAATSILGKLPANFSKEYAQGKRAGIDRGVYDKSSFLENNETVNAMLAKLTGIKTNILTTDFQSEIDKQANAIKAKASNSATLLSPLTSASKTPSTTATTPTQPNDLKVSGDININIHPDRNFPNLINALDTVQIKNQIINIIENHYGFSNKAAGQIPKPR